MRTVYNFNAKWAFTKQANRPPRQMPADWDWVNLPHTWNAIDGQDGGNDYYRGTGWYAKGLDRMDLPAAEEYYLEICGANSSAEVYLNGEKLAAHDGGYSTWRVNITRALKQENLFVIAVDNAPNNRVYPQVADFTFYGGLYRDVNIVCVSSSHFDLDHYGGPGLMVTPEVCGKVTVETWVTNPKEGQRLRYTVEDREGREVAGAQSEETRVVLGLDNPRLWQGRKDPYLYTVRVELMEEDRVLDRISTRFGFRSYKIDPEKGFILNGEEYPLRGVSRHQDRWGIGNALLPRHHREDMNLICEMGCNTIRLAHYQQDRFFYDLCDERGMVVWAEIPYISQHMPTGRENTVSQMKELIIQNYNHPSIVVWGISNEITMKGDTDPDLIENHKILNDLCHRMDKTRPTTMAVVSPCPVDSPYLQIPDTVAYNHYFGWYGGEMEMNGPWFDGFHARYPRRAIGCSEYGCEALNWHSSQPVQGDYTEEYQALYHQELIKQFFTRPYLWATYVWNMFDFGADARCEGGENGQNHKGLVTFDRSYKKDAFYAYKAWLSKEPFVHLCGKRYVNRAEEVTKVTVYSNQPWVELFANGESLGRKTAPDHFFCFEVPNRGETRLVAVAGKEKDESRICRVEAFDESYRLKDKHAVLNWFDITQPEGYLSLNSEVKEIVAAPGGHTLLEDLLGAVLPGQDGKVMGFEMGESMMQMMGGFTLLRLTGLLGAMNINFTKEQLLEMNSRLNRIPKPRAE